jgi:gluconolactonase
LLAPNAKLELAADVAFTEGPAADTEGNVYFTEIRGNRILRFTPGQAWTVFRHPSGRANGLVFDAQGRLLACEGADEGGGRRVSRMDLKTGAVETLADRYQGKRFNSPNDLTIDAKGRVYFTDPVARNQTGREIEAENVYLIDADGSVKLAATKPDVHKPNGIGISPDGKTLYVADLPPGTPERRRVVRFDIAADGSLSNARAHYQFPEGARGIDGMELDVEGNIYGAAGRNTDPPGKQAGIYIITPVGKLAGVLPIPEDTVTNCTFGGDDLRTLYVTAGHNLYQIRVKNKGFPRNFR